jgi:hypothetical protein
LKTVSGPRRPSASILSTLRCPMLIVGLLALFVLVLPISASASSYDASASRQTNVSAETASCTPVSPSLTASSDSRINGAGLEPAFDSVSLTRQGEGLKVDWALTAPLQSAENEATFGSSSTFNILIDPKPSDLNTYHAITLQIDETQNNPGVIKWAASEGGLKIGGDDKAPVTANGETVSAYFPFSILKVPFPRSFAWTAEEYGVQIGSPTGQASDPLFLYQSPQFAIEGCPTPSDGYSYRKLPSAKWVTSDLRVFPATTSSGVQMLYSNGGVNAIVGAIVGSDPNNIEAGTATCIAPPGRFKVGSVAFCNWLTVGEDDVWAFARALTANGTQVDLSYVQQVQCSKLTRTEAAAVAAYEGTATCDSPTGIYVPPSALRTADLPADLSGLVQSVSISPSSPISSYTTTFGVPVAMSDPKNPNWRAYYFTSEGATTGLFPSVGGLAEDVDGSWKIESGPAFSLDCNVPASAPSSVLSVFGLSRKSDCPPAPPKAGAAATSVSTTTTTSSPPDSNLPTQSIVFSGGINGLSTAIQNALIQGQLNGSATISDAMVQCGPASGNLAPGSDIACTIDSASVGNASLIVQINESPQGTFTPLLIGQGFSCATLSSQEEAAFEADGGQC